MCNCYASKRLCCCEWYVVLFLNSFFLFSAKLFRLLSKVSEMTSLSMKSLRFDLKEVAKSVDTARIASLLIDDT